VTVWRGRRNGSSRQRQTTGRTAYATAAKIIFFINRSSGQPVLEVVSHRTVSGKAALCWFAQGCAWACKTPVTRASATARRHHLNPAEAQRRWRGTGASRVRLGVRITTHALFALKVQRKVSIMLLLDRALIFGSEKSRQFLPSQHRVIGDIAPPRKVSGKKMLRKSSEFGGHFK
jgi:hypothetical protein